MIEKPVKASVEPDGGPGTGMVTGLDGVLVELLFKYAATLSRHRGLPYWYFDS